VLRGRWGCGRRGLVSYARAAFLTILHFLALKLQRRHAAHAAGLYDGALLKLGVIVLVLLFVVVRVGVGKNEDAKAQS
jgi:hypothetical protein